MPEKLVRCPRQPRGSFRLLDSSRPRRSHCRHPRDQQGPWIDQVDQRDRCDALEPDDRDSGCGDRRSRGRCRPSCLPAGVSQTRTPDPGRRGGAGFEWVPTGPGLLQEPGLTRLRLNAALTSRATRILATQRMGRCCGPGTIDSGMGGMSNLSELKEGTTHHTIRWRMTS